MGAAYGDQTVVVFPCWGLSIGHLQTSSTHSYLALAAVKPDEVALLVVLDDLLVTSGGCVWELAACILGELLRTGCMCKPLSFPA